MSGAVLMDHDVHVTRVDGTEASEVVWLQELIKVSPAAEDVGRGAT